jgi:hypothetical protein
MSEPYYQDEHVTLWHGDWDNPGTTRPRSLYGL